MFDEVASCVRGEFLHTFIVPESLMPLPLTKPEEKVYVFPEGAFG